MSRPIRSAGIASAATTSCSASAANAVAATTSVGSTISTPRSCGLVEVAADGVELVVLEQALADLVALGLEEGEDHAAADQQPVGRAEQVVDDAELVGDLRAAEHHGVRAAPGPRSAGAAPRPRPAPARRPRAAAAAATSYDAGLLAVHDAEAVRLTNASASAGQLVGERAALGVVLAGLARVEAQVLQQGDVAVGRGRPRRARADVAHGVGRRRPPARPSSSASRSATGAQRVAVLRARPWAGRGGRTRRPARPPRAAAGWSARDARIAAVVGDPVVPSSGTLRSLRTSTRWPRRSPRSSSCSHRSRRPPVRGRRRRARPGRPGGWSSPTRCRTSRRP